MSLNTYPYNPFPASTDKLDEAHNAELQQEVDQLKEDTQDLLEDVEKLETDKTDTAVLAPEFDAETGVYAVGDLVMYQGKLYEFTTAHETAGDWDSTEVTEKTVADELSSLESGLINCVKTEKHSINPNVSFSIALETTKLYNIEFTSINSQSVYNFYKYAIEYVSGGWKLCEIDKVEKEATHAALSFVITDNNLVVTDTGDWGITVLCQIASILL